MNDESVCTVMEKKRLYDVLNNVFARTEVCKKKAVESSCIV